MTHSEETKRKISESIKKKWKDKEYRRKNIKSILKSSKSLEKRKKLSKATKKNWQDGKYDDRGVVWYLNLRLNYLRTFKNKHPLFYKIEKPKIDFKNQTISVKCKTCKKLFAPSYTQLYERIRAIETELGFAENNLYCSDECKDSCTVFRKRTGGSLNNYYTSHEYNIFREYVLQRDTSKCQYCGKHATDVHHERPKKLEPLFVLDPDFAWSCCEKCHYEKGHKTGSSCSTGNLSKRIC